jgi:DNA-binding transcriptional LysR family regulator
MDLKALRIFKAIVDEGGVARAAQRLNYVQSNVSARLKQLEEDLDVALFDRIRGKLVITPRGTLFFRYAERILWLAEEAKAATRGRSTHTGRLKIGYVETAAELFLPALLSRFKRQHPQVDFQLETASASAIVKKLQTREVDVGLLCGSLESSQLQLCRVAEEELVLLTERGIVDVEGPLDVRGQTILSFAFDCAYQRILEEWYLNAEVRTGRIVELGSFETILNCVASGVGIAILPESWVRRRGLSESVNMHRLPEQLGRMPTHLAWRKDMQDFSSIKALVDMAAGGGRQASSGRVEEWESDWIDSCLPLERLVED